MSNARDIADRGHQVVAWVQFDGSAIPSLNVPDTSSIAAGKGVTSVVKLATGSFQINFESGLLEDDNYAVCFSSTTRGTIGGIPQIMAIGQPATAFTKSSHYTTSKINFTIGQSGYYGNENPVVINILVIR
tara:strand:- start:170 stop:562 length:393 start_codon:yes stop_codon:yes gene_type:complete